MDKALDMTLEDLIKSNKATGRGKGRGGPPRGGVAKAFSGGGALRGTGRGAGRQGRLGVNTRPSSLTIAKSFHRTKSFPWKRDLLEDSLVAVGLPRMDDGAKLNISNLDRGVSNDDIRELFSELGELKRYAIHFDKFGQPSGSAEVVYAKRSDAFAAQKRYHNVQLDGRPMKIEVVNSNSDGPVSARVNIVGRANGKATRRVVMTGNRVNQMLSVPANRGFGQRSRGGSRNGPVRAQPMSRGGARSGRGRGRGRGGGGRGSGGGGGRGKSQVPKSAEDLDKELEKYHAESMQIS